MSDSCQAIQRNLYRGDVQRYKDGAGMVYESQLKKLSWPISADLPAHAQDSAMLAVKAGHYSTLHPVTFLQAKELDEPNFTQSYGKFGVRFDVNPRSPVHERLFSPSKSLSLPSSRGIAASQVEAIADHSLTNGKFEEAIRQYTLAISQKAGLAAYEKRCAAYAHVGRYKEALADAIHILNNSSSAGEVPSARLRVKSIQDFLTKKHVTAPGHDHAQATLMCSLTPRVHRQWRSTNPSVYTRPYAFGTYAS